MSDSPSYDVTMRWPSGFMTDDEAVADTRSMPATFDFLAVCSAIRAAVPPMWNVRSVSCVPGSPIDCAAMMPTASPRSTMSMVARLRP